MLQADRFPYVLRIAQDNLDSKNFYAHTPCFDKGCSQNVFKKNT